MKRISVTLVYLTNSRDLSDIFDELLGGSCEMMNSGTMYTLSVWSGNNYFCDSF